MPTEFWNGLTAFERFFYILAVPSTFILIIQTIMTVLGFDHADTGDAGGVELGHDGHAEPSAYEDGFQIFTIRTVIAFFALFGWTGIALAKTSLPPAVIVLISAVVGFAGMLAVAGIFYAASKLQEEGNMDINNAAGLHATVYIVIPERRKGMGKVQVLFQERLAELSAVTDDGKPIPTGSTVKITGNLDQKTLIVTRVC